MATPVEGLALKGARDAALSKLTADTVSALTYDTGFDVTIQELSTNPDVQTVKLPGDDVTKDIFSKTNGITGTIKFAFTHLQALEVLTGGTMGTTSSTRTFSLLGADLPDYFKIEAKINYTGSDSDAVAVITIYKAKMTNITMSGDQDDYWEFSADFEAIPTTNTDQIYEVTIYDDDVDLLS